MPLVDLGPAPTKKKATGFVDLGPAPTPITEALTAVEEPTEERPRFEAAPEPSIGQRIKDYFREPQMPVAYDLPEGRKYRTLPPTREEQPLRSLAELGAYGLGQYGVGRALYTPELITERPVEKLTAPISAAEPTPKEKRIGESLKFIGGLRTAGQILGPVIATFPTASQQAIIGGAGVFGLRNITEQLANWARTGKTPSLEAFAKETALGALFGTAEAGLRGFVGFVKGLGNLKKGNVSWTNVKKPQDVADAIKHFQKTGDKSKWEAIRVKYAGITEEGAAKIKARAEAIPSAEAKVKEFGKFPLARAGVPVRPPTARPVAPIRPEVPPEGIKLPPKPTEAKIPPKVAPVAEGKVEELTVEQIEAAVQKRGINAEGFFFGPEMMKELGLEKIAVKVKDKIYSALPGKAGAYNHSDVLRKSGAPADTKVIDITPGFLDKKGRFIEQFAKDKEVVEAIRRLTQPPTPSAPAKEAWEMTPAEYKQQRRDELAQYKVGEPKGIKDYEGIAKASEYRRQKEAFADWKSDHKESVMIAAKQGKPVPRSVLEEYKGEKWVQEALAKPKLVDLGEAKKGKVLVGKELQLRLREAQRDLNAQTKRAFGKMTFDEAGKRLISEDGTMALQWYSGYAPRGYVRIDKIKAKPPKAPEVKAVKKPAKEITTKAEIPKEVKSHKIDILPHKEELLAKIDKAIKKAPDTSDGKTIRFEINGGINVYNKKDTLEWLRDKVKAQQPTETWPAKPSRPYKIGRVPMKPGKPGKAVAQTTEQYAENIFASLEKKVLAKKTKGSLAADLRKLEGSIPQGEWRVLDRELEDYSKWRPEGYLATVKLYRNANKARMPALKPIGKPGFVDITPIVKAGKALVGDIEIEPSLEVESGAFNKHLNYFQGRQLPKGSQVRKIQKQMQVVNGQRLAGTITAKEANKKIQQLKKVLFETAQKEGIALRMTKGGKVSVAVRKAGTYVPVEFAEYKKFKDISPVLGGGQDITRAIQQMDGSLTVKQKLKEPGQAGQLEQNVLWPTRDMSLQKLEWQKEKAAELKGLLKVRKKSKGDKQINLVLEQIASQDRNVPIKKILSNKTLRSMASPDVIKQAIKLREFYDNLIDEQNIARKVRGQKEIAYRRNYSPHILRDATIWEQVMMMGKKAEDIFAAKADLPDYIRPNKPFNPREMARKGGIPYEKRVISARELAEIYLVTASQDIFNTSIIQNHKAFIQQLEAMGFGKSANYLADWTAEAYAGVKPRLDRVVGLPPKAQKSALWFNRLRNMAVFPLNFAWNTVVQPSSLALTIGRYGTPNTLQGFLQWLVPSVRRHTAKNYYSYVIKASKQGKITKQDARNLIGSDVKLKMTPGEMIENAGGFITNQIEKLLTGTSIRAAHIHGKKRGLKGEALRNYASDGGAKTQSMYNDEDKPALLRNLTVKTAAPYQTFAYEVVNTAREWYGRTGTPPDTKLYRLWTVLRFLAAATVFAMIGKKLANRDVWSWKRPPIPFAEFWLSPIIRTFSKEYVGGSASGLTSPVGTAQKVAKGIDDVLETGNWRKLRNELIKYGPGIFGIPGGVQMSRTVDAIISYSQGGVRDRRGRLMFKMEDPQDLMQGIFSGVWTTKGGREVIERRQGKKPVGARKARLEREQGSTPKRGQEGTRKKRMEREKVMLRQ